MQPVSQCLLLCVIDALLENFVRHAFFSCRGRTFRIGRTNHGCLCDRSPTTSGSWGMVGTAADLCYVTGTDGGAVDAI